MQVLGGFSLDYGQGDNVCSSVCNMCHLAGANVHLRAVASSLRTANVRHWFLRVRRVSRGLADAVDVLGVHCRRCVSVVLPSAPHLHWCFLRAHCYQGVAPACG